MDFSTVIQNLNWLAVLVAALSTFLIGGLWYSIFEKAWMSSNNFSQDFLRKRKMPLVFGLSFVLSFIMALNLALFIGKEDFIFGAIAGFLTGFGWITLAIGIIALFENRTLKYVLINGGYMIFAFTIMGFILGAWK
jgi:hypothetical protein